MQSLELPSLVCILGFLYLLSMMMCSLMKIPHMSSPFLLAGEAVTVEDEVVVINSIVLPHKTLNVSVQEEIIL